MGQVPAKYFMPSSPYGSSDAVNALNQAQPVTQNPQTPLLPPNFMNPASGGGQGPTQISGAPVRAPVQNPFGPGMPFNPFKGMFGQ